MQVLKVGVPYVGSRSFTPQGEALSCEFLRDCAGHAGGIGYLWEDWVSASPVSMWAFFSFAQFVGVAQLVFVSSRKCSVYSCRFSASVGGGKFRTFLCHGLE